MTDDDYDTAHRDGESCMWHSVVMAFDDIAPDEALVDLKSLAAWVEQQIGPA